MIIILMKPLIFYIKNKSSNRNKDFFLRANKYTLKMEEIVKSLNSDYSINNCYFKK